MKAKLGVMWPRLFCTAGNITKKTKQLYYSFCSKLTRSKNLLGCITGRQQTTTHQRLRPGWGSFFPTDFPRLQKYRSTWKLKTPRKLLPRHIPLPEYFCGRFLNPRTAESKIAIENPDHGDHEIALWVANHIHADRRQKRLSS